MRQTTVSFESTNCLRCQRAISNALLSVPGVESVSLDVWRGDVTIRFDPRTTSAARLRVALARSMRSMRSSRQPEADCCHADRAGSTHKLSRTRVVAAHQRTLNGESK